jgi:hypothetical protein
MTDTNNSACGEHASSPRAIIERAVAAGKFVCVGEAGQLTITLEKPKGYKHPTTRQIDDLQKAFNAKRDVQARIRLVAQINAHAANSITTAYPVAKQLELLTAHAVGGAVADLQTMHRFIQETNAHRDALLSRDEIGDDWRDGWPEPEGETS